MVLEVTESFCHYPPRGKQRYVIRKPEKSGESLTAEMFPQIVWLTHERAVILKLQGWEVSKQ
jgi:hypothetical protein